MLHISNSLIRCCVWQYWSILTVLSVVHHINGLCGGGSVTIRCAANISHPASHSVSVSRSAVLGAGSGTNRTSCAPPLPVSLKKRQHHTRGWGLSTRTVTADWSSYLTLAWRCHTHNSSQNMSLRPLHWAVVMGRVSTEPGKKMPLRSIG